MNSSCMFVLFKYTAVSKSLRGPSQTLGPRPLLLPMCELPLSSCLPMFVIRRLPNEACSDWRDSLNANKGHCAESVWVLLMACSYNNWPVFIRSVLFVSCLGTEVDVIKLTLLRYWSQGTEKVDVMWLSPLHQRDKDCVLEGGSTHILEVTWAPDILFSRYLTPHCTKYRTWSGNSPQSYAIQFRWWTLTCWRWGNQS